MTVPETDYLALPVCKQKPQTQIPLTERDEGQLSACADILCCFAHQWLHMISKHQLSRMGMQVILPLQIDLIILAYIMVE
jgi:hypothetical protein